MLSTPHNTRIFMHTKPTDMRKSFDGLCGIVRAAFAADPTDGSWFLFLNRRRDRIKIMAWDRDGLALFYKRLEAGTFETQPSQGESPAVEIDATQLALILNGVSLGSAQRRKRYAA